jgi:hypothetical protein
MPNDAKLGLLAGVIGVIVAALLSSPATPAPPANDTSAPLPSAKSIARSEPAPPSTPAVLPAELGSTPVAKTKQEFDATATSRDRADEIDD